MEIPKLIRKLSGLFKLATDQAGTPEGDNARRQMDRLTEQSEVKISDEQLEHHEVFIEPLTDLDGDLAAMIADMTHTEASKLNEKIRFRGTRVCVEEAERIFIEVSQGMSRISAFVTMGYLAGAVGPERFIKYITDAQKAGKASEALKETLKTANSEEAKKFNPFDQEPTAQEGPVIQAATAAADPVKLWEGLKNGN